MNIRSRFCAGLVLLAAASTLQAAGVSVDLGATDREQGLKNSQRGDGTDGEDDPMDCGPGGEIRSARRNKGTTDNDFADNYMYFLVTDSAVKSAQRLRIGATFYDDPAFAASPIEVRLHYTNSASTGPSDLPNTFAPHARRWTLSGSGGWVRHVWSIGDAGFRTFMQGTSDFRFDLGTGRACVDRVDVALEPDLAPDGHIVGAHYYPWYDVGRWNYGECVAGALRLELDPQERPALGRYDSGSSTVIDRHLRWCAEYGVNLLILEFINPGGREDKICLESIFTHPRSSDVQYSVLYDWAIRFGSQFECTPERIAQARQDFDHLALRYFTRPTYLKVGGERPLAMIYVTRALSGDVEGFEGAVREACAARGFDVFLVGDEFFFPGGPNAGKIARWDGIFGYDAYAGRGGYWGTNGNLDLYRQRTDQYRSAAEAAGVKFIPSCAPGFNDRAIRRTCANNPALPRRVAPADDGTSLFREVFVKTALIKADPDLPLVSITSFNEWHEDTQIEPTAGGAASTTSDTSPTTQTYTQGYQYDDYGTAFLEMVRDATLAVTGRVLGPGGPLAGARVDVLDGSKTVLERKSFSTGAYAIPRLLLRSGAAYRLRATAAGFPSKVSPPFTVLAEKTVLSFDITLSLTAFVRGDTNADGAVDLSDAIATLVFLFLGDTGGIPCRKSADADGSGALDLNDAVYLLRYLFQKGSQPRAPFPACGTESAGGGLPCDGFPPCPQ